MDKEKRFEYYINKKDDKDWFIDDRKKEEEITTFKGVVELLNKQDQQIAELEGKLAEKDKEIEELKYIKIIPTSINTLDLEKFKEYLNDTYFISTDTCKSQITLLNQNEKAIEQLEKVKDWCENHKFSDEDDYVIAYEPDEEDASDCVDYLKDQIDNQINELKGDN